MKMMEVQVAEYLDGLMKFAMVQTWNSQQLKKLGKQKIEDPFTEMCNTVV